MLYKVYLRIKITTNLYLKKHISLKSFFGEIRRMRKKFIRFLENLALLEKEEEINKEEGDSSIGPYAAM